MDGGISLAVQVAGLASFPQAVRDRLGDAVQAGTLLVLAGAQTYVPVRKGTLKGSLGADTTQAKTSLYGEAFATAEYAGYVNFGTTRQAANPFMTRAAEEVRPGFNLACGQAVAAAAREAAGKVRG